MFFDYKNHDDDEADFKEREFFFLFVQALHKRASRFYILYKIIKKK